MKELHSVAPTQLQMADVAQAVEEALGELVRGRAGERIWSRDTSFWTDDPNPSQVVATRLGWLEVLELMSAQLPAIQSLVEDVRSEGFRHALLLGMGGSSLAPEVLRLTFGVAPGHLDLRVLDNTSPEAVRAAAAAAELPRTLFVVSTKSGTTTETLSFMKYFEARLAEAGVSSPGRHFVAITDPGTPLAERAALKGFRHTFLNPPDIGGRYSALSLFGVVPAALLGVDARALLQSAAAMAESCGPGRPVEDNPGAVLAAAVSGAARSGLDKLTILTSPALESFGAWLEQLVAESTGKEGRGVVPVDGEPWGAPQAYGTDRMFAALALEGEHQAVEDLAMQLVGASHPVARWRLPDRAALGGEFFRWEMATALTGALLQVDPFDEPNVTESKVTTTALLKTRAEKGAFPPLIELVNRGGLSLQADELWAKGLRSAVTGRGLDPNEPATWLAVHLATAQDGDYIALCAYLHRTEARHARLGGIRRMLGVGRATTLGYGPRFLHSTGQLHKGGPNTGVFLQVTASEEADLGIPGEAFTFGQLRDAQALGDLKVLDRRGRRALRVHLPGGADSGLTALEAAMVRAMELTGFALSKRARRGSS